MNGHMSQCPWEHFTMMAYHCAIIAITSKLKSERGRCPSLSRVPSDLFPSKEDLLSFHQRLHGK